MFNFTALALLCCILASQTGVVTAENAWNDVVRGAPGRMEHNLETTPLEVETKSECSSEDIVILHFQNPDFDDMNIGGLEIVFSNPPTYRVAGCSWDFKELPLLPEETTKIWTISLGVGGKSMTVACNGETVIDEDTTDCPESVWGDKYTSDMLLEFNLVDTASTRFRSSCRLNGYLLREDYFMFAGEMTEEECKEACLGHGNCLAMTYKDDGKECWARTEPSDGTVTAEAGYTSYLMCCLEGTSCQ